MALGINLQVGPVFGGDGNTDANFAPGTSADSNILKIYGMLDRTNGDKHYYQVFRIKPSIKLI